MLNKYRYIESKQKKHVCYKIFYFLKIEKYVVFGPRIIEFESHIQWITRIIVSQKHTFTNSELFNWFLTYLNILLPWIFQKYNNKYICLISKISWVEMENNYKGTKVIKKIRPLYLFRGWILKFLQL